MLPRSPNPFVRTRSTCRGHEEDHLTEFLARALDTFEKLRVAYCDFLLNAHLRRHGWGNLHIKSVQLQFTFSIGDRPDLVLELLGGKGELRRPVGGSSSVKTVRNST